MHFSALCEMLVYISDIEALVFPGQCWTVCWIHDPVNTPGYCYLFELRNEANTPTSSKNTQLQSSKCRGSLSLWFLVLFWQYTNMPRILVFYMPAIMECIFLLKVFLTHLWVESSLNMSDNNSNDWHLQSVQQLLRLSHSDPAV